MQDFVNWLGATPLSLGLAQAGWVVPAMQTVHLFAIAVIVSSVLMIDLRVMGWAGRGTALADSVRRFAPWFWGALITLAASGLVLIIAEPLRQLLAISFWLKMAVLAVGLTIAVLFFRSVKASSGAWDATESGSSRGRIRLFGVATFLVWCVVIFLGRFIAYDPQIWGPLSPLF